MILSLFLCLCFPFDIVSWWVCWYSIELHSIIWIHNFIPKTESLYFAVIKPIKFTLNIWEWTVNSLFVFQFFFFLLSFLLWQDVKFWFDVIFKLFFIKLFNNCSISLQLDVFSTKFFFFYNKFQHNNLSR